MKLNSGYMANNKSLLISSQNEDKVSNKDFVSDVETSTLQVSLIL